MCGKVLHGVVFDYLQIRVNAVNPTVALTDMGRKDWGDPVKAAPLLGRIPMGRFLGLLQFDLLS